MKKVLALILALAMVLSMAACGAQSEPAANPASDPDASESAASSTPDASGESEAPSSDSSASTGYLKDNITVAISADGGTFDPFASFVNWGSAVMTPLIFQGLIQSDYDYNIYYVMAKEINQLDDLHWEIKIWDSIYDTEGSHITIDDVIWGYDQVIASGNAGAIPKFESIEKTDDDYTAVMTLKEPFGDGDFASHLGNVKVLSKATYEAHGSDMTTTPVGTGPYMLANPTSDYVVGSTVVLTANENYWAKDLGLDDPYSAQNFRTITYKVYQSAASRAIALEMGEVDVCDALDAIDVDNLDASAFNVINLPQRPPVAIVMNASENSPLNSLELRQAILYALDNDTIAAALGIPAEPVYALQPNLVDSPASWSTGEGRDYYTYDPEKAKELVAASGYNGETLSLMYVDSTANTNTATLMQDELRAVGINLEMNQVDMMAAFDYQYDSTKWDIRLATLGGGAYLTQVLKSWWSVDSAQHFANGENIAMVPDAHLDELFLAVRADASEENVNAWDEYFNSMAYGYSICSIANQTACISELQSTVLTAQAAIVPNAFVLAN